MKYAKMDKNNIVVQVQPNKEDGFIEVDDSVIVGMLKQGDTFTINVNLDNVKSIKKDDLKRTFEKSIKEPVDINGILYHGGYDSALKLDAKRRLTLEANGIEVEYFDVDDNFHTHTLEEALNVCLAVANDYEVKLKKYKELCKLVDSKLKVETVESIIW